MGELVKKCFFPCYSRYKFAQRKRISLRTSTNFGGSRTANPGPSPSGSIFAFGSSFAFGSTIVAFGSTIGFV